LTESPAYLNYWRRKKLTTGALPHFPVRRWWPSDQLCEIEQLIFDAVRSSPSLLDVGAGDLRIKRKLEQAGWRGEYDTLDLGDECSYTYHHLDEVHRTYASILCLDLIEHLPLQEGLTFLNRLVSLLDPGGVLVVQTANARCIRNPLSWDMTHVHCYNLTDLWAYLTCAGLLVGGYRVVFGPKRRGPVTLLRYLAAAFLATRLMGCDYADNIVLIADKPGGTRPQASQEP
jgi:hypothetical protein